MVGKPGKHIFSSIFNQKTRPQDIIWVLDLSADTVRVISQTNCKLRELGSERTVIRQILRDKVIGHDLRIIQTPSDFRKERVLDVTTGHSHISLSCQKSRAFSNISEVSFSPLWIGTFYTEFTSKIYLI